MALFAVADITRSRMQAGALRLSIASMLVAVWIVCAAPRGNAAATEHKAVAVHSGMSATGAKKPKPARSKSKSAEPAPPAATAARPAVVSLKNGSLTIAANNSDLAQILRKVASISGMTIDGLSRSDRIFGHYGPGDPRDVLTRLLNGSGYNFIMVGDTADGAPGQLLLTAQNGPPTPPAASATASPSAATPAEPVQPAQPTDQRQSAAPGAPGAAPAAPAPADAADTREQRETRMQQFLQRLQQMHDSGDQNAPE